MFSSNDLKRRRKNKLNNKFGSLFSITHKDSYTRKQQVAEAKNSALCFNNRFPWNIEKFYRYKEIQGCACLYCDGEIPEATQHLVFPLGDLTTEKLKTILDFYYPAFSEKENPLKVRFVPSDKIEMFESIPGYSCEIVSDRDYDDYVYDIQTLRKLKGKVLKSKKNQLNRFMRDCMNCEYEKLKKEDMEDCLELTEQWCEERGIEKYNLNLSDYIPIKIIFDYFDKLDIRGGTIRLHGKLIAFSIGSATVGDTAFVHFEKTSHLIPGVNVAIIVFDLENLYTDAKYINREEDMGIEGLRTVKQSLNPSHMTKKNEIYLKKSDIEAG